MRQVTAKEFYEVCKSKPCAASVVGGVELRYYSRAKQLIGKACNINKKITYWVF